MAAAFGLLAVPAVAAQAATPAGRHATRVAKSAALHRTSITIDGSKRGRQFQGIGAVSGGGGNSRLLIDYEIQHPLQAQQILDYLFKPGYGAAVQILKLEIGGDAFATDGAEPSIEHTQGHSDCGAGYELWLAQQARKLNPHIQLYGLQWNAPGWVGGGGQNAWTTADISYIVDWLNCAKSAYGLNINDIGGWNEHLPQGITNQVMNWFDLLRRTLNNDGFRSVKIVGVDSYAHTGNNTDVADFLATHPTFRRAVGVLGYHNLCRYPVIGKVCAVPVAAKTSGKPIWESEMGALRQGNGFGAMARSLTDAYIRADATGVIMWPLLSSMPANLPLEGRGLVVADQPWTGQYKVSELTWILAQTTQFTQPGWVHVLGANSEFAGSYGSYNTYEATNNSAWSMVAQTSTAPAAQAITVHITGGLPHSVVHVWSTSINSGRAADWLAHLADIHPVAGSFSYTLKPGHIYTFSTVGNAGKGSGVSPTAKPMPLPYNAVPDKSNEPADLAAQDGAFEYLPSSTTTFEQTAVGTPVFWQNASAPRVPYAVLGDPSWSNYAVSASVTFTATGQSAGLISRFSHPLSNGEPDQFYGYEFDVAQDGTWKLLRNTIGGPPVTLAASSGTQTPFAVGTAVPISLASEGNMLTASINGTVMANIADSTYTSGDAGVSTGGWYPVEFTNFQVTS